MAQKKQASKKKKAAAVGAGLLAASAAAAGYYYFYGSKDAAKHRKATAKWATDLKRDVVRETKALRNLSREEILAVIDGVSRTYKNVQGVDRKELQKAVGELKDNWHQLEKEVRGKGKKTAKKASKTAKKAKKKTTKKK